MSFSLSIDAGLLGRETNALITAVLTHLTRAVRSETRGLEKDLEDLTRNAAGGKLWKAWQSEVYPRAGRPAYAPRGRVYVDGGKRTRGAIDYLTREGISTPRRAHWFAFPTEFAGPRGRGRDLTPEQWESSHGIELRPVDEGRQSIVMLMARLPSGVDVPMFILIPFQRLAGKFSIEKAAERRMASLIRNAESRLDRVDRAAAALAGD